MKTLVLYYSYTGKTQKIAQEICGKRQADIIEVKETAARSKWNAYLKGSVEARKQKKVPILPLACDLSEYDTIMIAMPIWAGYPAPAMNAVADLLPEGKEIELVMTSKSGGSAGSREKTEALISQKRCTLTSYIDIKS